MNEWLKIICSLISNESIDSTMLALFVGRMLQQPWYVTLNKWGRSYGNAKEKGIKWKQRGRISLFERKTFPIKFEGGGLEKNAVVAIRTSKDVDALNFFF